MIIAQRILIETRADITVEAPGGEILIRSGIASDSEVREEIGRLLRQTPETAYLESRVDRIIKNSEASNTPDILPDTSAETIDKLLEAERTGNLTEQQMTGLNRLRSAGLLPLNLDALRTVIDVAAAEYRFKDKSSMHIGAEVVILIVLISLSPPMVLLGIGAAVFWVIRGFAAE